VDLRYGHVRRVDPTRRPRPRPLAAAVGLDSLGTFRITSPGGNVATFSASAEVTKGGGGNNDAATWQAVIRVSGGVVYT
jgi:hypothetical protein